MLTTFASAATDGSYLRQLVYFGVAVLVSVTLCAPAAAQSLDLDLYDDLLDTQLDDAMQKWMADPRKGLSLDRARLQITLSKVFDWFAGDFDAVGGVVAFVARYAKEGDRKWLIENTDRASVRYFEYDWRVNAVR